MAELELSAGELLDRREGVEREIKEQLAYLEQVLLSWQLVNADCILYAVHVHQALHTYTYHRYHRLYCVM